MSLHPQVRAMMERIAELGLPPTHTLTPVAARTQYEALVAARESQPRAIESFEARTMPGAAGEVPVHVYRPLAADVAGAGERPPLLVYFHGGGHVFGNPRTHDTVTRNLSAGAGCVVVSVDYRKGPEHRFPAAAEDTYAVTRWCAEHAAELGIDAARIAVGGDSAGGNLAAVTALMARDAGAPALAFQLLVYPVADYTCSSQSYTDFATGYGTLEAATMHWFRGHYLGDESRALDWRASPLRAASHADLPPALVITAQYDVLHDEGVALADAMRAAGVDVTHTDYPGMIHGFFALNGVVDDADTSQAEASAALRAAFAA